MGAPLRTKEFAEKSSSASPIHTQPLIQPLQSEQSASSSKGQLSLATQLESFTRMMEAQKAANDQQASHFA